MKSMFEFLKQKKNEEKRRRRIEEIEKIEKYWAKEREYVKSVLDPIIQTLSQLDTRTGTTNTSGIHYVIQMSPDVHTRLFKADNIYGNIYRGVKIIVCEDHGDQPPLVREATDHEVVAHYTTDHELLTQIYFKLDNLITTVSEVR